MYQTAYDTLESHTEILTQSLAEQAEASVLELEDPKPQKRTRRAPAPKKVAEPRLEGLKVLPETKLPYIGGSAYNIYKYITNVEEAVAQLDEWINKKSLAAVDIETSATPITAEDGTRTWKPTSDCHTSLMYLLSVAVEPRNSIVFDLRKLLSNREFREKLKEFLTKNPLIAHNAIFEQSFFLAQLGVPGNFVFDTLLANQMVFAGLDIPNDLGSVAKYFTGITLDKTYQKFFLEIHPTSPLDEKCIQYSSLDVAVLHEIKDQQEKLLKERGLYEIWTNVELPLLPWLTVARVHGIPFVTDYHEEVLKQLTKKEEEIKQQYSQHCDALITSWQQVKAWFGDKGVRLESTSEAAFLEYLGRKKLEIPKNYSGDLYDLAKKANMDIPAQVACLILDHRNVQKALGTYVIPFLERHLNPKTGRIHPYWKQIQTDTGRPSCTEPNMQNIPSKGQFAKLRKSIRAPKGYKIITADYSQMELRILAKLANEQKMIRTFKQAFEIGRNILKIIRERNLHPNLLEFVKSDMSDEKELYRTTLEENPDLAELIKESVNCDFHTSTAAQIFDIEPGAVSPEQRTSAKTISFAVPYGAEAYAISAQSGLPRDAAQDLLDRWREKFRDAHKKLEQWGQEAVQNGYSSTPLGRKRFYAVRTRQEIVQTLTDIRDKAELAKATREILQRNMQEGNLQISETQAKQQIRVANKTVETWERITTGFRDTNVNVIANKISMKEHGATNRAGKNHPMQGGNADITKIAFRLVGERLAEISPKALPIMMVHDEIVAMVPEEVSQECAEALQQAMIDAADPFLDPVPTEVTVHIGDYWSK